MKGTVSVQIKTLLKITCPPGKINDYLQKKPPDYCVTVQTWSMFAKGMRSEVDEADLPAELLLPPKSELRLGDRFRSPLRLECLPLFAEDRGISVVDTLN